MLPQMTGSGGMRAVLEAAEAEQRGEAAVPASHLTNPFPVPTPNASYPPDAPGTTAPAGEPETAGWGLSARQERALVLLLYGTSLTTVGRVLGVNRRTVSEWVRRPRFAEAFNRLRAEAMSASLQRLTALSVSAVEAVEAALDPRQPVELRARTGVAVLQLLGVARAGLVDLPDVLPGAGEADGADGADGAPDPLDDPAQPRDGRGHFASLQPSPSTPLPVRKSA